MKRICIIYALLPLLIACEVESSEFSPLNSAKLKSYSVIRMTEYVAMPVEALEFALELDSYLKLSDIQYDIRSHIQSPNFKILLILYRKFS